MSDPTYTPPKVWKWEEGNGGKFANINRPVSGATHDKVLAKGEHPFQLHSLATPNGVKVTVMLEELVELGIKEAEYDAYLVNIMEGDQFGNEFVDINPNSKIPALLDTSTTPATRIFESGAILVYPKNLMCFYQKSLHSALKSCLGYSGKWVRPQCWVVDLVTFMLTHQKNISTRLIATPWK